VYNSYYYNIDVLLRRYITKYVSISILSTVCLVCNVQLTEVIIVFSSNKWVALIRAGWCGVCVPENPASSIRWVVQSDIPDFLCLDTCFQSSAPLFSCK